ncbi:hypothetical protein [Pseudonocardia kujensis]|uniref:hypothetical protein n=1 Tax=Pseudonocardia kujensis TaxID=1128675 RepID=UPI00355647F0
MGGIRVLVAGAGIAGPALAHRLHRRVAEVTVVERAVDARGVAEEVIRRMGLDAQVRAACAQTLGAHTVDVDGRSDTSSQEKPGLRGGRPRRYDDGALDELPLRFVRGPLRGRQLVPAIPLMRHRKPLSCTEVGDTSRERVDDNSRRA